MPGPGLRPWVAALTIVLATWSNLDFVEQTAGDHSASRAAIAEQRAALTARLDLAQAQRQTITETRSVDEINAAIRPTIIGLPGWSAI
jgi:hypothetical protein